MSIVQFVEQVLQRKYIQTKMTTAIELNAEHMRTFFPDKRSGVSMSFDRVCESRKNFYLSP